MNFQEEIFRDESCYRDSGLSIASFQLKQILSDVILTEQPCSSSNNLQKHFAFEKVDIYKFINPQTCNKGKINCNHLHGNEESLDPASHCMTEADRSSGDPFHTSEDIINFHVQSIASRTHAFNYLTQCDNVNLWHELFKSTSTVTNLEDEFQQLLDSDNLTVFIEEFELLISKLNTQQAAIHNNPDDIESLINFKLSIHLIKHLSEMMQAVHLKYYSHTVIEFLEDLVDGKTHITSDVTKRLSIVVDYFYYYKNSISLTDQYL